jgi:osmotically-inducible protein OsmY
MGIGRFSGETSTIAAGLRARRRVNARAALHVEQGCGFGCMKPVCIQPEDHMNAQLAATCVALGLALAPVAGYTAEKKDTPAVKKEEKSESKTEKAKEAVEDAAITTKIKAEYAKDKAVSALNIHVNTDHGAVTLTGNAKTKAEADKAEQIAKSVKGVSAVKNEIQAGGGKK